MVDPKTPEAPAASGGILRSLLPERSVEDVLSGRLRLTLGGSEFTLKVLTIDQADAWRETLLTRFGTVLAALEGVENAAGALALLATNTSEMIALIREYDLDGALPDDAWVRSHATEPDILRSFTIVLAANFPFVAAVLDILSANPGALGMVLSEFAPTKTAGGEPTTTSVEPTAGPSGKSARRSRTSSSSRT